MALISNAFIRTFSASTDRLSRVELKKLVMKVKEIEAAIRNPKIGINLEPAASPVTSGRECKQAL